MAVPTVSEVMDRIFEVKVGFIPERYPFTYGYDFLRKHFPQVVPQDVQDQLEAPAPMSRGDMARFCAQWATLEGVDTDALVTVFADAYLLENSISKG